MSRDSWKSTFRNIMIKTITKTNSNITISELHKVDNTWSWWIPKADNLPDGEFIIVLGESHCQAGVLITLPVCYQVQVWVSHHDIVQRGNLGIWHGLSLTCCHLWWRGWPFCRGHAWLRNRSGGNWGSFSLPLELERKIDSTWQTDLWRLLRVMSEINAAKWTIIVLLKILNKFRSHQNMRKSEKHSI